MNEQIIKDFLKAWTELDAELIIKHLAPNFRYDSQWVFESLDYNGYIDYIRAKFQTLKNNGQRIKATIIDSPYWTAKRLRLNQNGNICYYDIKIVEGKVVKGDMCMF